MEPRKIYVEIKVDGMTVNGDGIDFHFTCQSEKVDGLDTEVKMKIFNIISGNIESFIADGIDLFVETENRFDKRYVYDIISVLHAPDEDDEEDKDADGEEYDAAAEASMNSFIELLGRIFDKIDDNADNADDWEDEDDWDDDDNWDD